MIALFYLVPSWGLAINIVANRAVVGGLLDKIKEV